MIEPLDGASGELDYSDSDGMPPWFEYRDRISSAVFRGSVSAVGVQFLFSNCSLMKSVDLSGLDTSSATSMYFIFADCSSLASVDLSDFDTSSVTDMDSMFDGCSSLARIALGSGFSFEGSGGSRQCSLPDGYWRASSGHAVYAAADVPSGGAVVYSRPTFHDAIASTPHLDDVSWLAASGISTGYSDGSFRPFADVARCDMAAFLYRLAGGPAFESASEQSVAFSDVSASTPHYREILWLASTGVSMGWSMSDGTSQFRPFEVVKRADMDTFLHRMSDKGLVG